MLTSLFGLSVGDALGYLEAHKRQTTAMATIEAHKRRTTKIRIYGANTTTAYIPYNHLTPGQRPKAADYLDELRTQAKWDAEKCANQQSKNI